MNKLCSNKLSDKKGITLIEIIIILSIVTLSLTAVSGFLLQNIKNNKMISNKSEVQYQAQFTSSFINTLISQAYSVNLKTVSGNTVFVFETREKQNNGTIEIKYRYFIADDNKLDIITHTNLSDIETGTGKTITELADYLDSFQIVLYPLSDPPISDTSAKAVKLNMKFLKGDQSYIVDNIIYIRNKY